MINPCCRRPRLVLEICSTIKQPIRAPQKYLSLLIKFAELDRLVTI